MKFTATTFATMMMASAVSAFAPAMSTGNTQTSTALRAKSYPEVNGWVADSSQFCAGLPGSTAPLGQFDPLNLLEDMSVEEIKRYRESEVTHGRVAMLATLGYLVGENVHPLFGGVVSGPANTHLAQVQEVAPPFFVALTLAIGGAELFRALRGWKAADVSFYIVCLFFCSFISILTILYVLCSTQSLADVSDEEAFGAVLVDNYYPGDIGFDPLGLKPADSEGFSQMATKELQNGRLAMFGAAGMLVQEQITHEPILATLKGMF